jgi:predicted P-loop ATPase
MIARIYRPGCKFDHVLVMNGRQGIGKSSALQILASPKWFIDRLPDLKDKDAMLNLQGIWVAEMGELTQMHRSTVEIYKAFLSSQVDRFRLPYGRLREDFPRQCIITGSSNPSQFLNDPTGNRRFWPVVVKQCDFDGLTRDRDQLLAEAKWTWENTEEPLYLNKIETEQSELVQSEHTEDDGFDSLEDSWINYVEVHGSPKNVRMADLFDVGGPFNYLIFSKDARKVAQILSRFGYEKTRDTPHRRKIWVKRADFDA